MASFDRARPRPTRRRGAGGLPWAAPLLLALLGCRGRSAGPSTTGAEPAASGAPPVAAPLASGAPAVRFAAVHEGSVVARAVAGDALYVADEDHAALRRVALPLDDAAPRPIVSLPGPPAQVLALEGRLLVTVRDPGMLIVLRPDQAAGAVEIGRVPLPPDAWGVAVTPDERTALVTSAFSHTLSAVNLDTMAVRWSLDVAREPRAVVARPDGRGAYLTHLTGADLTRVDGLDGLDGAPRVSRVSLPASPLRAPRGEPLAASLSYSGVLSPEGDRLFVTRHALGALARDLAAPRGVSFDTWWGVGSIDVLLLGDDAPLAPPLLAAARGLTSNGDHADPLKGETRVLARPSPIVQPRAIVYRRSTRTLLVVSEGTDSLSEHRADAIDPAIAPLRVLALHGDKGRSFNLPAARSGGAPSGLALSADESTAYVFCRSTYDLVAVPLGPGKETSLRVVPLADDPLDARASLGRKLFYDATDAAVSGGVGCAGCHPDGRDDGHVWHQVGERFTARRGELAPDKPGDTSPLGVARQTPTLAGRVSARGPFGWHGQNPTLVDRLVEGFGLHRCCDSQAARGELVARALYLSEFVTRGLRSPPRLSTELSPEEQRGKALFGDAKVGCAGCHAPESGYTNRIAIPLASPLPTLKGFADDPNPAFKTPSLRFVAGTAPYYHDGSASTLEQLIEKNGTRMGNTGHLRPDERAALVAFLRTL